MADSFTQKTERNFESIQPGKESPYSRDQFFMDYGVISQIILNALENNNGDGEVYFNQLRTVLALFAIPTECWVQCNSLLEVDFLYGFQAVVDYYRDQYGADIGYLIDQTSNNDVLNYFAQRAYQLKTNPQILFFDEPDPEAELVLLDSSRQYEDQESISMVSMLQGIIHVRWTLPEPHIYQRVAKGSGLIYRILVMCEELCHISQTNLDGSVNVHSLNYTFNPYRLIRGKDSDPLDQSIVDIFRGFAQRLKEADVTKVIVSGLPQVLEMQWYRDRLAEKWVDEKQDLLEDHYPIGYDIMWMLVYAAEALCDQAFLKLQRDAAGGEDIGLDDHDFDPFQRAWFIAKSLETLPEVFIRDPQSMTELFTSQLVVGKMMPVIMAIPTPNLQQNPVMMEFARTTLIEPMLITYMRYFEDHGELPVPDEEQAQVLERVELEKLPVLQAVECIMLHYEQNIGAFHDFLERCGNEVPEGFVVLLQQILDGVSEQ